MAYRAYKQNDNISAYVTEFVADTEADLTNLPTSVYPGSTCIITESSKVFILSASGKWVEL